MEYDLGKLDLAVHPKQFVEKATTEVIFLLSRLPLN